MFLAQGTHHSDAGEARTFRSRVKHSTNKPLRSIRKNIEVIAVSVVIHSVILSFNVFKLYIVVQGPELQCLLKVKKDLS